MFCFGKTKKYSVKKLNSQKKWKKRWEIKPQFFFLMILLAFKRSKKSYLFNNQGKIMKPLHIEIKNTNYYQLIHKKTKMALQISANSPNFTQQVVLLTQPNNISLGQLWQIFEIEKRPNLFEIVHAKSTLVLEPSSSSWFQVSKHKKHELTLKKGSWRQLFTLLQPDTQNMPNTYCFCDEKHKDRYLIYQDYLRCDRGKMEDENCQWELVLSFSNPQVKKSCYLQNAFSELVIDVKEGSTKQKGALIQYHLNNRFNQRFKIMKCGEVYELMNMNSGLVIGVKKGSVGEGSPIIQIKSGNEESQWFVQYVGKNLYYFRLATMNSLFLGIEDGQLNQTTPLILTTHRQMAMWNIVGYFPSSYS